MNRVVRSLFSVLFVCALLSGCGGGGKCVVKGKVTFGGKPVVSGSVNMTGASGTSVYGEIQPDGSYEVKDVVVGEVKVGVNSPDPRTLGVAVKPDEKGGKPAEAPKTFPKGWFAIPAELATGTTSGIKTTTIAGENTYNIELKK